MADPGDVTAVEEVDFELSDHDELEVTLEEMDALEVELEDVDPIDWTMAERQGLRGVQGPPGVQGVRGPAGRDGAAGGPLSRTTAAPLAGGRVVVSVGADQVRAARAVDPDDGDLILGVVMASASSAGVDVEVVHLGLVRDSAWFWEVGEPVFCGGSGELTQAPGAGLAFWARVGIAVAPDAVFVQLLPPLYLS